jgi:urate oxidase
MLADSAYGKNRVRLVQVSRRGDQHDLRDVTVDIRFHGDYDASYVDGDNADVLPTDTMKNTVYALAASERVRVIETFGLSLARWFIARNPKLGRVRIDLTQQGWTRIQVGDRPHGQAFLRTGPEVRTARVSADREGQTITAGVKGLLILKSGRSAFTGFLRDELTTLAETTDRILATSLKARWRYRAADIDFDAAWHAVRTALLETFAQHDSASVQHTLYAMGQAVLDAVDEVTEVRLVMPNKHHLPVDLSRLGGLPNRNEIFVATDEPFGRIEATLARK